MSPDHRQHRGPHPQDRQLFAPERLPDLRAAVDEFSWLRSRGYPSAASLKLVGDRRRLQERQRTAVSRAACADAEREGRRARERTPESIQGAVLAVDGFNLIVTVEAALSGGVLLRCRDGAVRDLSSVHGSYRSVLETDRALELIGEGLAECAPAEVRWLLDRPISNSGRLAARIRETAESRGWPWSVELVFNPDTELVRGGEIVISSDSAVLDGAAAWLNLPALLLRTRLPEAWVVDFRAEVESG